jgi:hypothetical protein
VGGRVGEQGRVGFVQASRERCGESGREDAAAGRDLTEDHVGGYELRGAVVHPLLEELCMDLL